MNWIRNSLLLTLLVLTVAATPPTRGLASWYGEDHRGKPMANTKPFDPDKLTCASWFYPFGTKLRVSCAEGTSRSVIVTVTDRGPNKRFKTRIVDLSAAAFKRIAHPDKGLTRVRIEVVE